MNATQEIQESHLSPTLVDAISAAYRDTDSTLARRVKVIRRAMEAGFTVKSITADMAAAAAVNPEITAVTATIYGYAAAAAAVLNTVGVANGDADSETLATLARAAKHAGIGAFKDAVRGVLAPLSDDVDPGDKLGAVASMCDLILSEPRKDRAAKTTRAAQPNMGSGDISAADVPDNSHVHPAPGKPDAAEFLAGIRRATKYLTQGGAVDANMASAISEFVAAASAAQRRQNGRVLSSVA